MARMLKRWESPRREGRNDKGRGGAARQRQLKKRTQALRKKLQDGSEPNQNQQSDSRGKRPNTLPSNFLAESQNSLETPIQGKVVPLMF
jgi:hypothetical protein